VCDNGNVVVLPTWSGLFDHLSNLCQILLPWLQDLASSITFVVNFVNKRRHGIFPMANVKVARQMRKFDKVISGDP
jgi:hypothetical protein